MERSVFETTLKNLVLSYVSGCARTLFETRATHRYDNERFNTNDARVFLSSFCEAVSRNFTGDTKSNVVFEIMKQTAKNHREFCVASFRQTTTDALLVDFINFVLREHCKAKYVLFSSEIEDLNL
jgi:adenylyl- and sulfurtransferase ThiI